jgi:AraC-like DNA-binding protein
MTFLASPVRFHAQANIVDYPPGAVYGPRVNPTFEFVWVLHGAFTWEVIDAAGEAISSHRLTPGLAGLSTPGTFERYRCDPAQAGSHAFVHFELQGAPDTSDWPRTRLMSECPPLGVLADGLFDIALVDKSTAQRRTEQAIGLMLDAFLDSPMRPSTAAPDATDRAMVAVRAMWARDGVRIAPVADIAHEVGVSTGYLSRSFTARFGLGPSAALELIRLGRVAVALQRTSSTLARIAADNGFTDEFYLSRRFSRVYGMPPGAYRRHRADADPLTPIIERRLTPLWNGLVLAWARDHQAVDLSG